MRQGFAGPVSHDFECRLIASRKNVRQWNGERRQNDHAHEQAARAGGESTSDLGYPFQPKTLTVALSASARRDWPAQGRNPAAAGADCVRPVPCR